ncbi:hypothetical protein BX666DRAFT_1454965 [Dichotomocladium elegans]|nr:hypothetical protein BX666DRAFT_1454965 [Dichotomocladium elegans]
MCWCSFLLGEMNLCRELRQKLVLLKFDRPASLVEEELYNRVAWVIYVMDQWLFIATNERIPMAIPPTSHREPRLEDDQLLAIENCHQKKGINISRAISSSGCDDDSESATTSLLQITAFAEMIRLAHIVYKDPADRHSLTKWLTELPSYLEIGTTVFSMTRIIHIFYHAIILTHHNDPMAMRTMLAIAEQTEEKFLYNTFGTALTHAVNHCLCEKNQTYLDKSLQIMIAANPTLLSQSEMEHLLKTELVQPAGLLYNMGFEVSMITEDQNQRQEQGQKQQPGVGSRQQDSIEGISTLVPYQSMPMSPVDLARLLQSPGVNPDMFTPWDTSLAMSPLNSPAVATQPYLPSPALTMATTPADSSDASPTSCYTPFFSSEAAGSQK